MFMLNWVWLEFLNSVYTYSPPAPRHVEVLSSLGVLSGLANNDTTHRSRPDCLNLVKILPGTLRRTTPSMKVDQRLEREAISFFEVPLFLRS